MDDKAKDVGWMLWSLVVAAVLASSVPFLAAGASTVRAGPDPEADARPPLYVEAGLAGGARSVYRVPVGTSVAGLFELLELPRPAGAAGDRPIVSGESLTLARDGTLQVDAMAGARLVALGLPVPVNRSGPTDLAAVPGIGAALALRIGTERAARGPFRDARDLSRVEGMSETKIAEVEPFLSF
jgi:competence protein ComEA